MRKLGIALVVLTFLIGSVVYADSLTFTNTSSWDSVLLERAHTPISAIPDWRERITIPPPPANVSLATLKDLIVLWKYRSLRTPERIAEINDQINPFTGGVMGGRVIGDYFNPQKFPATAAYLAPPFSDISIAVLTLKEEFNRARPSVLFPFLGTTIDVPHHPAYPSGHSTQSYFIAYMLARAVPERADEFLADAKRIAEGREVAGLHYPSDSAVGELLAKQWADLELARPEIAALLPAVRAELGVSP